MKNEHYDGDFDLYYKIVEKKVVYEKSGNVWLKSVVKTDYKGSYKFPLIFVQDLSENVDRYVNLLNNSRKENVYYEKQVCFISDGSLESYKVYSNETEEFPEIFF